MGAGLHIKGAKTYQNTSRNWKAQLKRACLITNGKHSEKERMSLSPSPKLLELASKVSYTPVDPGRTGKIGLIVLIDW